MPVILTLPSSERSRVNHAAVWYSPSTSDSMQLTGTPPPAIAVLCCHFCGASTRVNRVSTVYITSLMYVGGRVITSQVIVLIYIFVFFVWEFISLLHYYRINVLHFTLPVPILVEQWIIRLEFLCYFSDQVQVLLGLVPAYIYLWIEVVLYLDPERAIRFQKVADEVYIEAPDKYNQDYQK